MSESPASAPASSDVTSKEVADFLSNHAADLTKGVDLPTMAQEPAPAQPPPPPPPKLPADPAFAPNQATQGKALETLLPTDEAEFSTQDITLTDAEKETFLQSVLLDAPVELAIHLPGMPKVPIVIRTRTNAEQALMFATLEEDRKEKRVENTMAYLSWLQYYDASLRLVSFGTVTLKPNMAAASSEALRAYARENFLPMSVVKWRVLAAALRLFDLKINSAVNSVISRDFSQPAG